MTPEALTQHQDDDRHSADQAALHAQLRELDRRIANLLAAIEAGGDLSALTQQLQRRTDERNGLHARLNQHDHADLWTPAQMTAVLDELGGIAAILPTADPTTKTAIYASLGLRLEYNHAQKTIRATADKACVPGRVRGGT